MHVHTDFTTGDFPIDEIVQRVERQGIGAIFLAENYLLRVEYGLPPFRSLLGFRREEPSVLGRGVERYLAMVAEARQRYPTILIEPGVEMIPHYWWSGSPLAGDLTVHDLQKNILVFGLASAGALGALPATGSPATARYSAGSVVAALPALLLVPGLVLLARGRPRRRVVGRVAIVRPRRSWLPGGLLCAVGLVALVRGFPFTTDTLSPYEDLGTASYQDLIDAVEQQGGAAVWSFPDSFDYGEQQVFGVRVQRKTDPYGDDLLRTFRYSAFGGVYEDTTRFPQLGGGWDYLLGQYARGERSRPAWVLGESGFHGDDPGKWLGAVETVFLVPAKTDAALIDALRHGHMYGVLRTDRASSPVLDAFGLTAGEASAIAGDTVRVAAGTPIDLRASVRVSDGSERPVRVTLVRNGGVARVWSATTPAAIDYQEVFDGAPAYFRLEVRGPGVAYILSNPITVRP